MTRDDERIVCSVCGQDHQTWYRISSDGRRFLLCPECDSVWLPGEPRREQPRHHLKDLFTSQLRNQAWDLIEPDDPTP